MNQKCYSQTQDIIGDFVGGYNGDGYMQTYLCFERAIYGKPLSQDEREYFWNRIVFYNYVQYAMRASRVRPNNEQWSMSESALVEMLEKYMPDFIIVWGHTLFNKLPSGKDSIIKLDSDDATDVRTYEIKGKKIPALKTLHPSWGLGKSWPYWHQFYVKFLGL